MKCITASLLVVTLGLSVHADPVPVTIGMPTGEDLEAMFAIAVSLAEAELAKCVASGADCSTFAAAVEAARAQFTFYAGNEKSTFTMPPTTIATTVMPNKRCQRGEKECCNGNCIQAAYAQDGEDDCGDSSDENLQCGFAPKTTTGAPGAIDVGALVTCALTSCGIQAMSCVASETCMPLVLGLAGIDTSGDMDSILAQAFAMAEGDDTAKPLLDCAIEKCLDNQSGGGGGFPPTAAPRKCGEHEAQCCNGLCVSLRYFKDGDNDCGDWSDEKSLCGFEDLDLQAVVPVGYTDMWGDDDFNLFGSGMFGGDWGGFFDYDDDLFSSGWSWGANGDWEECEDGEDPFRDIHEACEQDCTFNKGSRGLLADDDDGYAYAYGYYGYDDDNGWSGGLWGDLFGGFFGAADDDDDEDRRGNTLDMCAADQSDYGVACKSSKQGSQKCQKAINKLSIAEVHHYVNKCHGNMPYLFESTATTIPEIVAFYRHVSDKCGGSLDEENFPLPDQTVLHLMLKEAQRKVAAHCLAEKPDYEIGHCRALEEEIKQYISQVHPDIAAAAELQSQLDAAKAKAEACTNNCGDSSSQVSDIQAQLDAARATENAVLAASQAGTEPEGPTATTNSNIIGIVVGVAGCVIGLAFAVFFAVRSKSAAPPTIVVQQGVVNAGAPAFDNPNYDPNVREAEEPAYEDMEASNPNGYMDVAPTMADVEA